MDEDAQATRMPRVFPTLEELEQMHRDNVRAVLLEHGVDPAIVESEIERFMNQPSRLKIPSAEELATMYGRQD